MMGFLKLVCDTGWFVLVPYRCFSVIVIVISETICNSFDFFSCVLYYIKLHYITLSKLLPGICQLIVTLAIVLLFACTFDMCNKILLTYLCTVSSHRTS